MLAPPYSSETVMPSTPSSPILRHRSIGNWSLRSISVARGAISASAKLRTASRSASTSSPSMKFKPGRFMALSPVYVYVNVNCRGAGAAARAGSAGRLGGALAAAGGSRPGEQALATFLMLCALRQRDLDVLQLLLQLHAVLLPHAETALQLRHG